MGLLSTMSLLSRTKELIIFGPKGLDKILDLHFKLSYSKLSFPWKIIFLSGKKMQKIYENEVMELYSFGLKHHIPCWGFKLVEKKKPRKILKSALAKYNIPIDKYKSIKLGADYVNENNDVILNKILTKESHVSRSYAYCSDTVFFPKLINHVTKVDLLYHEATFHSDLAKRAKETFHSTSKDAAYVASMAKVNKLILGHFSSRYKNLDALFDDAKTLFKNVVLAKEMETWKIKKKYLNENYS